MMVVKKIEHVGIQVENIEKSKQFYVDVLGLEIIEEIALPHVKLAFIGLHSEILIELIEAPNTSFPNEGRVHHLAFTVDNIEEKFEYLQRKGVTLLSDNINVLTNGAKYFFFQGPDNERLEFFQKME